MKLKIVVKNQGIYLKNNIYIFKTTEICTHITKMGLSDFP